MHEIISFLVFSYTWQREGFTKVPASRSDVFKDRTLDASEKRSLTLFLKSVVSEIEKRAFGMVRFKLKFAMR